MDRDPLNADLSMTHDVTTQMFGRWTSWRPPHLKSVKDLFDGVERLENVAVVVAHADDAEISLGGTICWLVRERGVNVTILLLFAGYRCPGLQERGYSRDEITKIRLVEANNACGLVGAEMRFLDLSAYHHEDYLPTDEDVQRVADALADIQPQLVFVHPRYDHRGHESARGITALGYLRSGLRGAKFLSFDSPWNALGGNTPPTHYFPLTWEADVKQRAIRQFPSQLVATNYCEWANHHAAMWKIKAGEAIHGNRAATPPADFAAASGLEVFRLEEFDPELTEGPNADPLHMALAEIHQAEGGRGKVFVPRSSAVRDFTSAQPWPSDTTLDRTQVVYVDPTPEQSTERIVFELARDWLAQMQAGRGFAIGGATGRTFLSTYRELHKLAHVDERFDLRTARAYFLDEYCGGAAGILYHTFARQHLHVGQPDGFLARNVFVPRGMFYEDDRLVSGARLEDVLREAQGEWEPRTAPGPDGQMPQVHILPHATHPVLAAIRESNWRYDQRVRTDGKDRVALLGIGTAGHIGFVERGAAPHVDAAGKPLSESGVMLVRLAQSTRRDNAPDFSLTGGDGHEVELEPARFAVTQGIDTILSARRLVLAAHGEKKQAAVRAMLLDEPGPHNPAAHIRRHSDVAMFLDAASFRGLSVEALRERGFRVEMEAPTEPLPR